VTLRTGLAFWPKAAQTLGRLPDPVRDGPAGANRVCRRAGSEGSAASPVADPVVKIKLSENLGGAAGLETG